MFRFSVLPTISLDSMIDYMVVKRAFNTELFTTFIEGLLDKMNPFLSLQSVLIMDNCAIHKSETLREVVEGHGCRLHFLPPYSPDLNPIEESFSCCKY